jgi:hypothetical protein
MAQQNYTSLIALAGIGALAWYGYEQGWFASLFPSTPVPTPTPTGSTTGTTTGTTTPSGASCVAPSTIIGGVCTAPLTSTPQLPITTEYNGPADLSSGAVALIIQLAQQTATPSNPPQLNIDQWAYYYNLLPGVTPLTGDQVSAMLNAAGATGANRSSVLMAPGQFVALLNSAASVPGLSGYSGIPYGAIHQGRYA